MKIGEDNCDGLGTLLYEDLGCKPVKQSGKKCPVKYDWATSPASTTLASFGVEGIHSRRRSTMMLPTNHVNVACFCNNRSKIEERVQYFARPERENLIVIFVNREKPGLTNFRSESGRDR
ncbi:hypothetical protein NQ317_004223 [Molorchus minor]|uniref:Uncharacterized protein n=1 Tax=Molorchus minor TaxID=1323400 RepID=A0ABQ9JN67_9CUCU|nr:hypothetical protein NQ317_004223 [Molorchus minor]